MNAIRNGEIHLSESPDIHWFEKQRNLCTCGRRSDGILRGTRNESFGPHCEKCAAKRLRASAAAREFLAKAQHPTSDTADRAQSAGTQPSKEAR